MTFLYRAEAPVRNGDIVHITDTDTGQEFTAIVTDVQEDDPVTLRISIIMDPTAPPEVEREDAG